MNIRKTVARAAGIGAVATAALGLFSTGAANADTFIPLPGADLTKTLSDGTVVHIWVDGESANINPSMGSTPVHRNAWVTGSAHVDIGGDTSATGGSIYPGYVRRLPGQHRRRWRQRRPGGGCVVGHPRQCHPVGQGQRRR